MLLWIIGFATFIATLIGGLIVFKFKTRLHNFLGFTAGVLMGVVVFELLPEIFEAAMSGHIDTDRAMIALISGFLLFHIVEKSILIHRADDQAYGSHTHPHIGVASAMALIGHSFLDGLSIGVGFLANPALGLSIAVAVIAHKFTDGINTVNLMLTHKNKPSKALVFLLIASVAPIIGILIGQLFVVPESITIYYLSFFAGFLLYIGSSEILPEAHSKNSSYTTILMTLLGVGFIYVVTNLI